MKSWGDSLWMKDMQDKSTMSIYRKFKHTIRDEQDLYGNAASSVTLFRVRTGTLKLVLGKKAYRWAYNNIM